MSYLDRLNQQEEKSELVYENSVDEIYELITEAANDTHIMLENLYPKIEAVLSTPQGDRIFKNLVGRFMDRNSEKLHEVGPIHLITFGENDKMDYFNLFKIGYKEKAAVEQGVSIKRADATEINTLVNEIVKHTGSSSDFKLLRGNPIFWVFYCCIRYYTLKNDQKGINSSLAIYALSDYPLVFHHFFKYGANADIMQYTIDNLTDKYIIKQQGNIFNALFVSIQNSYKFLKPYMKDASDKEMIRFIQRIRNDQRSMLRKIADKYYQNHAKGLRVSLTKDSYDGIAVDVDAQNKTSTVEFVGRKVALQILTQGTDLKLINISAKISEVSISECRFYISKILTDKYSDDIQKFIESVLFLYLYDENKKPEEINSKYFLHWSEELFRKTNSNNDNIKNIKQTLDKWAEETGVHNKYKREASRVSYKKAIFFYFIFCIQNYNN